MTEQKESQTTLRRRMAERDKAFLMFVHSCAVNDDEGALIQRLAELNVFPGEPAYEQAMALYENAKTRKGARER